MSIRSPVTMPTIDRDFQRWCFETHELRLSGVGSPVGVVTPKFIGQEYLNTSGPTWFKSTGLLAANWVAI